MGYMDAVMMQISETVSDERGTFHAIVMARERNDGSWEGWLEFVPVDNDSCRYATPIETRQHDRVTMERWASGLTAVYADGALARARARDTATAQSDQRVPHVERAGEAKIAADARRLRAAASERLARLRHRGGDGNVVPMDREDGREHHQ
jgi:hypothetical protein